MMNIVGINYYTWEMLLNNYKLIFFYIAGKHFFKHVPNSLYLCMLLEVALDKMLSVL